MKILILFSGSLRTLYKNLHIIKQKLTNMNIQADIYLYNNTLDNDHNYTSGKLNIHDDLINNITLLYNDQVNNYKFDQVSNSFNIQETKITNTWKQWYKLNKLFSFIPLDNDYDYIVRMRPDIEILSSIDELQTIFMNIKPGALYVPSILMHDSQVIETYNMYTHMNDQFAIADYQTMKVYCNFYNHLATYANTYPFISEIILYYYLVDNGIKITYINILYKLSLSYCNIIAISGDSGAGKSTLMNYIERSLIYDKYIKFETDRYHKWNRGNENWNVYTHLDPHSNYLEKMYDDTYNLKIGNDVYVVDYDHATGQFTNNHDKIDSNNNIILCGLHTLYHERMLNLIDIKIFVDTQDEIKRIWKLRRDVTERGYSYDSVMMNINKRLGDYNKYIKPQINYADIIVRYYSDQVLDITQYAKYSNMPVKCQIIISGNIYQLNKSKFEKCGLFKFVKYDGLNDGLNDGLTDNYLCQTIYDNHNINNQNDYTMIIDYLKSSYNIIINNYNHLCIIQLLLIIIFN